MSGFQTGMKSRLRQQKNANTSWTSAVVQAKDIQHQLDERARHWGASSYRELTDSTDAGRTARYKLAQVKMVPMIEGDDGKDIPFEEDFPMEFNGRVVNVAPTGIKIMKGDYIQERIRATREESEYLDKLLQIVLSGGDEILYDLFGKKVFEKCANCLPSQIGCYPPGSKEFSAMLSNLRSIINVHKKNVTFDVSIDSLAPRSQVLAVDNMNPQTTADYATKILTQK